MLFTYQDPRLRKHIPMQDHHLRGECEYIVQCHNYNVKYYYLLTAMIFSAIHSTHPYWQTIILLLLRIHNDRILDS